MLTNHGRPVRAQYYGTREIRAVLGIGKQKANEIMHMFEERGQLFRIGRLMKIKESTFLDWLTYECNRR